MSEQPSNGSKLGAITGVVITIAFFLPWVKACNSELTGYDLATNRTGFVEDAWVYWVVLLAGLVCVALFFLIKTTTARRRRQVAFARMIVGSAGFLPLVTIWLNVKQKGGLIEIVYGGWIILANFIGIYISFLIDLVGPPDKVE